ncbi:tyrosine-protein phosphatase [Paenibacillus macquariensis]|uniref:Tyrosine-protein phosphatase n=1 Tax=Paenibacillus macquariensis TaxID=948756 RepID=A0ABY1JXZ8_9BACL|nr:CpsB/CapC family capsule biosynthesis tyrosine phosphatase [Paenibacillus macquariensis]MEC0089204.1 protein tyrosine phosphatase [Paenibacillus macquariensis]OAB33379.1 protein tyrosine phosphatase [Paenibacillus macquariensis subsp. macquariensis]SIQ96496.1 protein-tyrosine phosphatase [Paenibacillus macquariensis]
MIDIHTHILPGVDDGAQDWHDTLNMARAAVEEGITTLIATPHHANGKYNNTAIEVIEHTRHINEQLKKEGVPLSVRSGQEIRLHGDWLEAWYRMELLTLADSRYVLIELPSSRIPKEIYELIYELNIIDLKPIIAHPERNAEIMKHPKRLADLIERGAWAQVTTHSLLGGFGRQVEKLAWSLCKSGLIHIVSSDAHHIEHRGFRLRETYDVIEDRMGEPWKNYFLNNAQCVIDDRSFEIQPIEKPLSGGILHRLGSYLRK